MKIFLLITLVLTLSKASINLKILFLEEKLKHDKVVVYYNSTGCFHHASYQFTFENKKVKIEENIPIWFRDNNNHSKKLRTLGTLLLTEEEICKLNKLLIFYINGSDLKCTNSEQIKFDYFRKDEKVKSITYIDNSCEAFGKKDLLTLSQLIYLVEENKIEKDSK